MDPDLPRFFFDYVDPWSYIVESRIADLETTLGLQVVRHPLEMVLPPSPMIDPDAAPWRERWETAKAAGGPGGPPLRPPALVPWSRKAHELALYAGEDAGDGPPPLHRSLFRAFHLHGKDIGRVDVLVELAVEHGFDRTRTKAVLDVDRHLGALRDLRREAERLGAPGVPTLLADGRFLQGIPGPAELRDWLTGRP